MADGDFSRSVTKIDRMQHLAAMPLDDAEASWEEYAAVRKIIIIYLQVVGLWDYIVDFAAAAGVGGKGHEAVAPSYRAHTAVSSRGGGRGRDKGAALCERNPALPDGGAVLAKGKR